MKKLLITIALFFMMVGMVIAGTTVTLQWDANTEMDLAGYHIWQDGVMQLPAIMCEPNELTCCTWTSQELSEGTHEWFLTAFDTSQNESGHSNTVSYNVDLTAPGAPINIQISINILVNP